VRLSLESLSDLGAEMGAAASRPAQQDEAIDFSFVLLSLVAPVPTPAAPAMDVATPVGHETSEDTSKPQLEASGEDPMLPLTPELPKLAAAESVPEAMPPHEVAASKDVVSAAPIVPVVPVMPVAPIVATREMPREVVEVLAKTPSRAMLTPDAIAAVTKNAIATTNTIEAINTPETVIEATTSNAPETINGVETITQAESVAPAVTVAVKAAAKQIEDRATRPSEGARPSVKEDSRSAVSKFTRVAQTTPESTPQVRPVEAAPAVMHLNPEPLAHAPAKGGPPRQPDAVRVAEDNSSTAALRSQLVETMRVQIRDGGGKAELRLNPEFLGAVKISVVVEHGSVRATFLAESPAAIEHVQKGIDGLRDALAEHGLRLDEFEIIEDKPAAELARRGEDDHGQQDERPHQDREQPRHARPAHRPIPSGDGFAAVFDVVA